MAPKRANPKADEAAKAALLAARKGKALALTHSTHQEATEDNVPRACEDDTLRTCGPEGQPQLPSGFAPPEGADLTEDGEVALGETRVLWLRAMLQGGPCCRPKWPSRVSSSCARCWGGCLVLQAGMAFALHQRNLPLELLGLLLFVAYHLPHFG
jgi:hypothetical protein